MKRTIGLLLAVVFALALFSPPLRALDHAATGARFSSQNDSEPWIDLNAVSSGHPWGEGDPWVEQNCSKNNLNHDGISWFKYGIYFIKSCALGVGGEYDRTVFNVISSQTKQNSDKNEMDPIIDNNTENKIPGDG